MATGFVVDLIECTKDPIAECVIKSAIVHLNKTLFYFIEKPL